MMLPRLEPMIWLWYYLLDWGFDYLIWKSIGVQWRKLKPFMTFKIALRKACAKSRPLEQSDTGTPQQFSTNLLDECPNVRRMILLSDNTLVTDVWYSLRPTIVLDPRICQLNFQGLSSLCVKLDCTSLTLSQVTCYSFGCATSLCLHRFMVCIITINVFFLYQSSHAFFTRHWYFYVD